MNETVMVHDVKAIHETAKALLCVIDGQEVWIPKSQIDEEESEVQEVGDEGILVIPTWLADRNGL
jgi:hypothetical protein